MIRCPHCGASHYSEGPSMCTAVYYPPIWKDGVNTNPDGNVTTTKAHCCECNYDFIIKTQYDKVWTELGKYNPPKAPLDTNITVPIETHLATATINVKTNQPVRTQYQWEIDIEEMKKEIKELKQQIEMLAREVYALN